MKEWMEKLVPLKGLKNPDALADKIESVAEVASHEGWYFVSSATDEWMETVTLFFERDLEV